MIRYDISEVELQQQIEQEVSGWTQRAQRRTDEFRKHKKYHESSSIWSEIKPVYIKVQRHKCAYCERRFEDPIYGLIEHDVEHFRPKSRVNRYPPDKDKHDRHLLNYDFPTGDSFAEGYYLLAYHPLNYITACKTCNTILKSDFFPIGGKRHSGVDDPTKLSVEKPWLIYPLGDNDANPEDLLEFNGINPIPRHKSGNKRRRAQVVIDFFQLDKREELRQQRAEMITALYSAIRNAQNDPDAKIRVAFEKNIQRMLSSGFPHTNCLRSFYRLYQNDAIQARRIFDDIDCFLDSMKR